MSENKIIILMDDEIFSIQDNYGGISKINADYLNFFCKDKIINFKLPFHFSNNSYLKNTDFKKIPLFKNFNIFKKDRLLSKLNSINIKKEIIKNKHDILHLTYMNIDLLYSNKKVSTCIIHDTIPEKYPKYFNNPNFFLERKELLLNYCNKIITVSNTTKNDLLSYYKIDESKIEVIHPSIDCQNEPNVEVIELPKKYIMYVGKRSGYKNFLTVLELLKKSLKKYSITLLCVGGEDLTKEENYFLNENNLQELFLLRKLNNSELNYAYQNAIYFIYSSLYEGFGIPILEAQRNGCLVLCNNISAFNEVGKDTVIYYNDFNELIHLSDEIINNKFKKLKIAGRQNILRFNNLDIKKKLKNFYINALN